MTDTATTPKRPGSGYGSFASDAHITQELKIVMQSSRTRLATRTTRTSLLGQSSTKLAASRRQRA